MPHLSPRRGLCQPLVLIVRVSGTQTTSLVKLSNSGPTLPCGVARRQQAGLPKGAGFRGLGEQTALGWGTAEAGLALLGLPAARWAGASGRVPVFLVWMAEYGRSRAGAEVLGSGSGTCVQADEGSRSAVQSATLHLGRHVRLAISGQWGNCLLTSTVSLTATPVKPNYGS